METKASATRTRCVLCLNCANSLPDAAGGEAACAAGARPPAWEARCENFVRDLRPARFTDRRRAPRPGERRR